MLSEIKQIGFIGGGNMAGAIIGGLISAGYSPSNIVASDPYEPSRKKLEHDFQIATTTDNVKVVQDSEIVILAVKPQILDQVARGLVEVCRIKRPVFISIVAGITISDISQWLDPTGQSPPFVIRCMPNTPALVHQGAAGLYASDLVNAQQRQKAMAILASISPKAYWVDSEHLLDIVTGLSGSGPAYFFYIVEALVEAGVANGLELHVARGLAAQTCLGAGQMLISSNEDPAELRKKVTSPNGTTHAGITSLDESRVKQAIIQAVQKATNRSKELGTTTKVKL